MNGALANPSYQSWDGRVSLLCVAAHSLVCRVPTDLEPDAPAMPSDAHGAQLLWGSPYPDHDGGFRDSGRHRLPVGWLYRGISKLLRHQGWENVRCDVQALLRGLHDDALLCDLPAVHDTTVSG